MAHSPTRTQFPGRSAEGQALYGSLTGNVIDPSGAAVAGAQVEATNTATGGSQRATTDGNGIYRLPAVQAGTYKVTISAPNFARLMNEDIRNDVNSVRRLDIQLRLATTQETVTVTGETPSLQTDKADVHTDLTATQIENFPITSSQGRNFQALYRIIPGFGLPMEANSAAANPQRAISANVNGQSIQGNNTRIDGAQNSYPWLRKTLLTCRRQTPSRR